MRIGILSGVGAFANRRHAYDLVTEDLVDVIRESADAKVGVRHDVEDALADLDAIDVLVLNIGRVLEDASPFAQPAIEKSVTRFLRRGGAIWAHHESATAFEGLGVWGEALGGRMLSGEDPPRAVEHLPVAITEWNHPITRGIHDFEVENERYALMQIDSRAVPLARHSEGARQPLLWATEVQGSRAVVDLLGHTRASYRQPVRRKILRRSLSWLIGKP